MVKSNVSFETLPNSKPSASKKDNVAHKSSSTRYSKENSNRSTTLLNLSEEIKALDPLVYSLSPLLPRRSHQLTTKKTSTRTSTSTRLEKSSPEIKHTNYANSAKRTKISSPTISKTSRAKSPSTGTTSILEMPHPSKGDLTKSHTNISNGPKKKSEKWKKMESFVNLTAPGHHPLSLYPRKEMEKNSHLAWLLTTVNSTNLLSKMDLPCP